MDFLRDAIWQSIGVLFGVIAIIVSVFIYWKQRNIKSLSYNVDSESLLFFDETIKERIEITLDGKPARNIYLMIIEIFNDGNMPIIVSDYERPISFNFGNNAEVISAIIMDMKPESIKASLTVKGNILELDRVLLNPKDHIRCTTLVNNFEGIRVDARIVGVSNLIDKKVDATINETLMAKTTIYSACFFMLLSGLLWIIGSPSFLYTFNISVLLLVIFVIYANIVYVRGKKRT